jgi:hypothetical protein
MEVRARFVDQEETIWVKLYRQRTCFGTDIPGSLYTIISQLLT